MSDENQDSRFSRRSVIHTVSGIAVTSSISGVVSGRANKNGRGNGNGRKGKQGDNNGGGPPTGGKNTCPKGTALLAKYEVEGGEFRFEEGSDFLEAGDSFDFTVTETKEDKEVLAFDFTSIDDVYDVHTISVKTGAGVFRKSIDDYEGSFDAQEHDGEGPVQAVSNVLLCSKVFWQADLGIGDVPEPPNYSAADAKLVRAALGNSTSPTKAENPTGDGGGSPDIGADEEFDIDFDAGTIEIGFTGNTDSQKIHLASFERPGPFKGEREFQYQDLFDTAVSTSTEDTLSVDIPTPEDYE